MTVSRTSVLGALGGLTLAAGLLAAPAQAATNDPLRAQQWGLDQIHAEAAWPATTGAGVVVAVVDSGVDLTHPDLQANLVPGATFIECGPNPCGNGDWKGPDGVGQANDAHGSHVSGIIAAVTNNGIGVAGVAPDAKIMPIKALEDGSGSFEDIAAGIRYAADHGADVINMSIGAVPGAQALSLTGLDTSVTDAIAYADSKGVRRGRRGRQRVGPGLRQPVVRPGRHLRDLDRPATRPRRTSPTARSSRTCKAVAAPGGCGPAVLRGRHRLDRPAGQGSDACGQSDYDYYAGTSMATPQVAGVAALLVAQGRTSDNVKSALIDTARTPGSAPALYTTSYGHGIVDAAAATAYEGAAVTPTTTTKGKGKGKGEKK